MARKRGQLHVLGPTRLVVAGETVELSGRQRSVLGALAFGAPRPQATDALIPLVWGDDAPKTARAAIQNAIAAIRRRAGDADLIQTGNEGYSLGRHVDIDSGAALADAGELLRADPDGADPEAIAAVLAGWPANAYADLADIEPVVARRGRFSDSRAALIDQGGAALIARGRLDEAIGILRTALIEAADRQPRVGLLALALHRNGATADALRVLDIAGRQSIRETGVGLTPAVAGLERRILDRDQSLAEAGVLRDLRREPARLSGVGAFHGRVGPLADLRARVAARESVLVRGTAGIGKSALVHELARQHGGVTTSVRCAEGPASPYEPILEIVRSLERHPTTGPLFDITVPECDGPALAWVLPSMVEYVGPREPVPRRELRRERADAALVQLIRALADHVDILLTVDDLHQAPEASRRIVASMAADTDATIVAAARPEIDDRSDADAFHVVDLEPMNAVDARAILAELLAEADHSSLDTVSEDLAAHTGGNALFLLATIRHVQDLGAFRRAGGRWTLNGDLDVPPSVEVAIAAQLNRLSARGRSLVEMLAIAGDPLEFGVVTQLCGPAAGNDVREAVVEGLVVTEDSSVRTTHQLVSDAVCRLMDETPKLEAHDRLAAALERNSPNLVALIARHRYAARSLDPAAAVDALVRAGDEARSAQAPEFAAGFYRLAQEIVGHDSSVDEIELAIALGATLRELDDVAQVGVLVDAGKLARKIERADLVAAALIELGDSGLVAGIGDVEGSVVELLDHALAHLDDPCLTARLQAGASIWFSFSDEWRRSYDLWDAAARAAKQLGDRELLRDVYLLVDQTTDGPDQLARRAEVCDELRKLAEEFDDSMAMWRFHLASYGVAAQHGSMADLAGAISGMERLEPAVFNGRGRRNLALFTAGLTHVKGDLDESERILASTASMPQPFAESLDFVATASIMFVLRTEQDRLAELDPLASSLVETQPGPGVWRIMAAVAAHAAGDDDRARARMEEVAETDFETLALDMTHNLALTVGGDVAVALGLDEIAAEIHRRLLPYSGRAAWTGHIVYGPVDLALARIAESQGRIGDAADHLDTALDVGQRLEAPIFSGRSSVRMAALATASPELANRWPHLEEAIETIAAQAETGGWVALNAEIERLPDRR